MSSAADQEAKHKAGSEASYLVRPSARQRPLVHPSPAPTPCLCAGPLVGVALVQRLQAAAHNPSNSAQARRHAAEEYVRLHKERTGREGTCPRARCAAATRAYARPASCSRPGNRLLTPLTPPFALLGARAVSAQKVFDEGEARVSNFPPAQHSA